MKKMKTKDGQLEVMLHDVGAIYIESNLCEKVGIRILKASAAVLEPPKGTIYEIQLYDPRNQDNYCATDNHPIWIMNNGKIK